MPSRLLSIFLIGCLLALGTGALNDLHLRTHLLEDAHAGQPDQDRPDHSGRGCGLCAQLHVPSLSAGWVPLLVCLGLFVAFLTLLTPPLAPQHVAVRIGCRGPPVL